MHTNYIWQLRVLVPNPKKATCAYYYINEVARSIACKQWLANKYASHEPAYASLAPSTSNLDPPNTRSQTPQDILGLSASLPNLLTIKAYIRATNTFLWQIYCNWDSYLGYSYHHNTIYPVFREWILHTCINKFSYLTVTRQFQSNSHKHQEIKEYTAHS